MDPPPVTPVPAMPLGYAAEVETAGARAVRWVGWLTVAVACADALAGLLGSPFGYPERRPLVGEIGLSAAVVGWIGSVIGLAAGVGLVRRRRWAPAASRAFAVYAVLYGVVLTGFREFIVVHFGSMDLQRLLWAGLANASPGVHWAAFPVLAWQAVRFLYARDAEDGRAP
jgi:hypothetical protein